MSPIMTGPKGRNPAARDVRRGTRDAEPEMASPQSLTVERALGSFAVVRDLARALERREESIPWFLAMLERGDLPPRARRTALREFVLAIAIFGAARSEQLGAAALARHRATDAILEGLAALGAAGMPALERLLHEGSERLSRQALDAIHRAGPVAAAAAGHSNCTGLVLVAQEAR